MHEGWNGDDYLVIFEDSEATVANDRYGINALLPGYSIIGLCGWDDFIVRDGNGRTFTVPTVPLVMQHLAPFDLPMNLDGLAPDGRFTGRIKWYITPVACGGDPQAGDNLTWVDHDKHSQLVRWWNDQLRSVPTLDDA
jgi:hypothetical protein